MQVALVYHWLDHEKLDHKECDRVLVLRGVIAMPSRSFLLSTIFELNAFMKF